MKNENLHKTSVSNATQAIFNRAVARIRVNAATRAANDIGEIPYETINWERRNACRNDQILFEKTYLPMVCEKPNAPYHLTLSRYDRRRMGLPPVATNPLEQSLRSWLFARKFFVKPVSATRHEPFSTERQFASPVAARDPHPLTLETIRPNFAILDDVQNDQSAARVTTVQKLDKIIANAIRFLPKPGEPIAILMPCTVIESNDLADTYGNPELKPEWPGTTGSGWGCRPLPASRLSSRFAPGSSLDFKRGYVSVSNATRTIFNRAAARIRRRTLRLSCCYVADYGTFPTFGVQHYRRRQANDWRLLTKSYLATRNIEGEPEKVNVDDIYTWGLRTLLDDLISRKYTRADENNSELVISHIGMDAQEGLVSPIVRDVCKKYPPEKVLAYHGFGITGGRMGMETYTAHDDTTFEDMRNPSANARRWMYKFSKVSRAYELHSDVNAWKDYLMERIRTPKGERGSLVLFAAPPFAHELFAVQVCESEHSESVTARGVTRNRWVTNPGTDNEFWDCLVGCCCLASFAGCVYVPTGGIRLENARPPKPKKTFRERLEERKQRKGT